MKQFSKKLFSLVVLFGATNVMLQADCNNNDGDRVLPFLQWRSQGRAMDRKLYGTTSYAVYQGDMDSVYGTFNATLQYDQSFRNNEISKALFGASLRSIPSTTSTTSNCNNSCDEFISISGLENADGTFNTTRGAFEWMAENFILPRDFKSTIAFSPKVQDVLLDLNLFVGLDRWCHGLYFRLYGPITWNKASLNPCENIIAAGTQGYQAGYFAEDAIATTGLFKQALSFFGGCAAPVPADSNVKVQPLRFAKFSDCNFPASTTSSSSCNSDCGTSQHKTGFAELRGEFGWNYIQEKYRFLLNIQAAAPTGSRVNAEYLFPAQIGNGKHWELGVGLGGAWRMWGSEDGEKSFNFIVEADITHLFNAKQTRTFDLKNKPNSRYMLAEKLVTLTAAGDLLTPPSPQFNLDAGEYAPVANLTTKDVKVSIGVQGDLVAMFNYTVRGFSWDLGYNFWAMSGSKINVDCNANDCPSSCPTIVPFVENTWALKGDASVAGYNSIVVPNQVFALGATENSATIYSGTNGTTAPLTNVGVDNHQPAVGVTTAPANVALFVAPGTVATPIQTSVQPIFIKATDFDIEGAEQRGLSNKVFTHFSYTWLNHDKWVPYVGAGFSAEFGSHSGSDCTTTPVVTTANNCPSSLSFALSKWAVEVKGGVSFH